MRFRGQFEKASKSLQGDLIISFVIDESNQLKNLIELGDEELDIEIDKHRAKRSLNANAYFWKLCDQIAKKIGSDKDSIYKLQLSKYGVFVDCEVWEKAVEALRREFRHVEEISDGYGETKIVRCYFGSSGYNTKEMSDLLNGTRQDAIDLGCDVWDQDQIDALIKTWKGEKT